MKYGHDFDDKKKDHVRRQMSNNKLFINCYSEPCTICIGGVTGQSLMINFSITVTK